MNIAQFDVFMANQASMLAVMTRSAGASGPGEGHGGKLIAKYVNISKFSGKAEEWDDWAFTFKRTVRSMSQRAFDCLKLAEKTTEPVTPRDLSDEFTKHRSGELYDILCQNCTGEAMSLVKSVEDMEGFRAWQILYNKYNPKTMARGVRMLIEIVSPPKLKDLTEIETAIQKWENKLTNMRSQFGDGFSERMKIAIFTNMLPATIQDYIYSIVEDASLYDVIKEKVRSMVSNKVAMGTGPAPMDIGGLQEPWGGEEWHEDGEYYDVGAVTPDTKCYRCQGYGHFSRDCATKAVEKGKGKGHEKGKGKGQGQEKGKGKGKGKSFPGTCWTCGKDGHRAHDCKMKVQSVDDEAEEETPIGGVWMIGAVEAEWEEDRADEGWKMVGRGGGQKKAPKNLEEQVMIAEVEAKEWTRASGMMFHVADVAKPLASAAKVCEAGNRIVMDPEPGKSYVENVLTGERMLLKKERGTFVFEVEFLDDGGTGHITLDSGAGVSVWPKKLKTELKTLPKKAGLNMIAANGTKIENFGQKLITFKGLKSPFNGRA
jgi:hypothetical protein